MIQDTIHHVSIIQRNSMQSYQFNLRFFLRFLIKISDGDKVNPGLDRVSQNNRARGQKLWNNTI